jgi:carbon storage regulator CsrA
MLILSRKIGEGIIITTPEGHRIRVILSSLISGDQTIRVGGGARFGIDAPRDVTVHREEVQREVERGQG